MKEGMLVFLMYRVELKELKVIKIHFAKLKNVPNVPYGVERPSVSTFIIKKTVFLMYRVELKDVWKKA